MFTAFVYNTLVMVAAFGILHRMFSPRGVPFVYAPAVTIRMPLLLAGLIFVMKVALVLVGASLAIILFNRAG